VQVTSPNELREVREEALCIGAPVRAVVLDLKLGRGVAHGGAFQGALRETFPGVPVISLSVEDIFSQVALLKRRRLFCYLNKRTLTEERGSRDEVTAFCQHRDAVLLASLASVVQDLREVWGDLRKNVTAFQPNGADQTLDGYMQVALDELADACRREFHARWQDADYPRGLACRQVVRSFGLVNDKWCECVLGPESQWPDYAQVSRWPCAAYHYVNTALRNEASHAKVPDACFQWLDVWIMKLAMILKMEGMVKEEVPERVNDLLEEIVRALRPLLCLAGRLDWGRNVEEGGAERQVDKVASEVEKIAKSGRVQIPEDEIETFRTCLANGYVAETQWAKCRTVPKRPL